MATRLASDLVGVARDFLRRQVRAEVMHLEAVARADHRRHQQAELVPLAGQRREDDCLVSGGAPVRFDHQPDVLAHGARNQAFLRDRELARVPAIADFAQQRLRALRRSGGPATAAKWPGSASARSPRSHTVPRRRACARRRRRSSPGAVRRAVRHAAARPARTRPGAPGDRSGVRARSPRAGAAVAARPPAGRRGGPGRRAAAPRCCTGVPTRGGSRR